MGEKARRGAVQGDIRPDIRPGTQFQFARECSRFSPRCEECIVPARRIVGNGFLAMKFLKRRNLGKLLDALAQKWDVFVPVNHKGHRYFRRWPVPIEHVALGDARTVEPVKGPFFRPRERVADGFHPQLRGAPIRASCLFGVTACDLKGLEIQDFVFAPVEDPDPFYIRVRSNTLIVAADCAHPMDTCFCTSLGVDPYPTSGCDLGVSRLSDGFIVEAMSEAGRRLLDEYGALFAEASEAQGVERAAQRDRVRRSVAANAEARAIPSYLSFEGMVMRNYNAELWKEEAKNCVECGACNTACPTCHCYLLCDQRDRASFARFRLWDSCMLKDFARVGGGGNPRPQLWMRLRNRFEKKFDFFPKVSGMYACTGCGRCISACPARIDIRHVLSRLAAHG